MASSAAIAGDREQRASTLEHSPDSAAIACLTASSRSSAPASTPSSVTPVTLTQTPSAKSSRIVRTDDGRIGETLGPPDGFGQ